MEHHHHHYATHLKTRIHAGPVGVYFHRGRYNVPSMYVGQSFVVTLTPETASGGPGAIDAPPKYNVDAAGIVTITPSADGLTATVLASAVGNVVITPNDTANALPIAGNPIAVTVTPAPVQWATQLVESIGPVTGP